MSIFASALAAVSGFIDIPMEGMGGPTTRSHLIPRDYDFPTARGIEDAEAIQMGRAVHRGRDLESLKRGPLLVGNIADLEDGAVLVGNISDLEDGAVLVGQLDDDGYYYDGDEEEEEEEEVFEEDAALDPLVFFAGPGWGGHHVHRVAPRTPRRFPRAHFRGSRAGAGGGRRFGGGGGGFRGGRGGGGRRR